METAEESARHPNLARSLQSAASDSAAGRHSAKHMEALGWLGSLWNPIDPNVKAIFEAYDSDGNGHIDVKECALRTSLAQPPSAALDLQHLLYSLERANGRLQNALGSLGMKVSNEQARIVLRRYDADKNNTLELVEFDVLVKEFRRIMPELDAQASYGPEVSHLIHSRRGPADESAEAAKPAAPVEIEAAVAADGQTAPTGGVVMVRSSPSSTALPIQAKAPSIVVAEQAASSRSNRDLPAVRRLSFFLQTGKTGATPRGNKSSYRDESGRRRSSATESLVLFLKNIGVQKPSRPGQPSVSTMASIAEGD